MQSKNNITSLVNSFGGISFIMAKMKKLAIPELVDSMLGKRVRQARYSYADIFLGWVYCNLCGAKRIEDIYTENLHSVFKSIPIAKLCSPDSVARIFKRFATPSVKHINVNKVKTDNGVKEVSIEHELNYNNLLNDLLLQFNKQLGNLNETETYLLDYDGTTVPTEKRDAKQTYKDLRGYSPAVTLIGKHVVAIEGRNGNTPAAYRVKESLNAAYERLEANGIKTWGIRMDAASYQEDVINLLLGKKQLFYIRAANREEMIDDLKIAEWTDIDFHNYRKEQIGSVVFFPFKNNQAFRFVVTRYPNPNRPDTMIYRGIITNDMDKEIGENGMQRYKRSDIDVVKLYDQRGDAENNFRDLLNDFNWRRVPFCFMNENMVFMYVAAMAKSLFDYLLKEFNIYTSMKDKFKLKKFVAYFVKRVSVLWTQQGEEWSFDLLNLKEKFEALQSWAIRK